MEDRILIVNQNELVGTHKQEKEPYEYFKYKVTPPNDFDQCSIALYEIPPMKSSYPYHYHIANIEAFYIISGEGILKTPDGDKIIKEGDFIICPPSENGAHKITNTSNNENLKYIDFDTTNSPDVLYYPDSDKTGIKIHNKPNTVFKNENEASYYDGE